MVSLLRRMALLDSFQMNLPMERNDFINTLNRNIGRPQPDILDFFSPGTYTYKGFVTNREFVLTRKRKFLDADTNYARAKGRLSECNEKLKIDIDVNGFHPVVIPFFIFASAFYIFFITALFMGHLASDVPTWLIALILSHAFLIFGLPYLIMRKSVSAMKSDIERDINMMMRNKLKTID